MKLYLISRTDDIFYNQDMQCVVIAKDKESAKKIAIIKSHHFQEFNIKIEEIDTTKEGVILTTNKGS